MACEICGRSSCTKSFHSFEEQHDFDSVADDVKNRIKYTVTRQVNGLPFEYINGEYYVKLSDVLDIVDSAC